MGTVATVSKITPGVRELHAPAPLRELQGWLIWRYEARFPDDPKPLKTPYYVGGARRHGKQGAPADRAQLTTFAAAREAAARRGFDGVGFALMPEWGITALDFDHCLAADGSLPPEVEHLAARTYCEFSPSGKGVRAFLYGDLGNRKSPTTADQFGFETFASTGFVTATGDMLPGVDLLGHEDTIAQADDVIVDLCSRRFASSTKTADPDDFMAGYEPRLTLTDDEVRGYVEQLDAGCGREQWIAVGMALHHQYDGENTGFDLWHDWSEGAHNYVGEEDLRTQWDSFERRKGPGQRQVTMASVIKMANDAQAPKPVTAEQLADVPASDAQDFKFRPTRVATLSSAPPRWLIKSVLPRTEDPVVLFGSSGSGKSFLAIDLAAAIARGVPWRGNKTAKGRVLYIAAEGMGGIRKRIEAYCRHHEIAIDALDIDIIAASPNILEADDIKELVKSIRAFGPYDLVIIDTLAQVTPGANENAGEDMGLALANIKAVQRATHATVVVVHHAGKDLTRGSRGWSGIKAAAEAQLEVLRDEETGARQLRVDKMKDGEDGKRYGFRLETLVLAMDEDGDEVTSCAVVEAEVPAPRAKGTRGGRVREYNKWETILIETGRQFPSVTMVPRRPFMDKALTLVPQTDEYSGRHESQLSRALETMAKVPDGPVGLSKGLVILYE